MIINNLSIDSLDVCRNWDKMLSRDTETLPMSIDTRLFQMKGGLFAFYQLSLC